MHWVPLVLLAGCAGNIQALYEQEKDKVLAAPPSAGTDWKPEIRLRLSDHALQEMATLAVDQGLLDWDETIELDNPLGVKATVKPKAAVDRLTVRAGDDCGGCLDLDAELSGKARWKLGSLSGEVPFDARVAANVTFDVAQKGDEYKVNGTLARVDRVVIGNTRAGDLDVTRYLEDWIAKGLKKVPAIPLGTFGSEGLPIRKLRLDDADGGIEIQALTDVAGGAPVSASTGKFRGEWELRMSEATTLALVRREAFEKGPITEYTIALDPRSLDLDAHAFTMGLRLWRLEGRGWWREYTVKGSITTDKKRLRFKSESAEEGEKSQGAGLADPLALLVEGRILDAVADGVRESVPVAHGGEIGKESVQAVITEVKGAGDALVVTGDIEVAAASGPTGSPGKKGQRVR